MRLHKKMALELFKPFIYHELQKQGWQHHQDVQKWWKPSSG
jgi:DNA-directed RNA polymerase beta' subunit